MSFNVKSCGLVISRETNSSIAGQTVQSILWDPHYKVLQMLHKFKTGKDFQLQ